MPDDVRSLYRRWRSRTFSELIGQEHVSRTLLNALESGRVAHAYLFAGPRGSGKTSTARILAKAVNCLTNGGKGEPCNECEMCVAINEGRALDLIEIDAASNRGIDEIRDLRDKVRFSPTEARYKVYILDEAHMLTNEAFNALLKTLEEPPPHVIFALVTTEAHKIPLTILSRCQRFDLHRASNKDIIAKLNRICDEDHIKIEPAALAIIARTATGSYRDAESLLDQLASFTGDEGITVTYLQQVMGLAPLDATSKLVSHIAKRDVAAGIQFLTEVMQGGADLRQFSRDFVDYLRDLMLVKTNNEAMIDAAPETIAEMRTQTRVLSVGDLVRLIKLFTDPDVASGLRASAQPQLPLELAFLEACGEGAPTSERAAPVAPPVRPALTSPAASHAPAQSPSAPPTHATTTQSAPPTHTTPSVPAHAAPPLVRQTPPPPVQTQPQQANAPHQAASTPRPPAQAVVSAPPGTALAQVQENWPSVLEAVKAVSRSVEAFLKECRPTAADADSVTLSFKYPFHKDSVDNVKNRAMVEETLSKILTHPVHIQCTLLPKDGPAAATAPVVYKESHVAAPPVAFKDSTAPSGEDAVVKSAMAAFGGKVVNIEKTSG